MIQTVEQIAESVRSLPLSDLERFFDLVEPVRSKIQAENEVKRSEVADTIARFKDAERWIEDHKEEYDGQWVCLYGDQLIAHGADGKKVYDEARAVGILSPFIERIKAKELPFGGW
jgi:hypothetical protein